MRLTIERKFLSKYGWRWVALTSSGEEICHFKLQRDAALYVWERNTPMPERQPLSQSDIDSRPAGFEPQGMMRRLIWKASKAA